MQHIPVLFHEVREAFVQISPRKYIVDATQGLGWHTKMLLENAEPGAIVMGIDRDSDNIAIAKRNLQAYSDENACRHIAEHSSFASLEDLVQKNHFPYIDFILYDLGVSSAHYDDASRGFSLRFDGPLDMRFDRTKGKTAQDLVMNLSEEELRNIFYQFADEKKSPFIARAIVEARKHQVINSTHVLTEIIQQASFDKKSPLRVFQALRIAVNNEFDHIIESFWQAIKLLRPGWMIAVITFHSIEDRIVKQFFAKYLTPVIDDVTGQILQNSLLKKYNKKPIIPWEAEISDNIRSRSAKLRIYMKNP